jgi:hypothetical protein
MMEFLTRLPALQSTVTVCRKTYENINEIIASVNAICSVHSATIVSRCSIDVLITIPLYTA